MISPGQTQELQILRRTKDHLVLGDDDLVEVTVPIAADPTGEAERLRVFVHLDAQDRPVATMDRPKAEVGGFATMQVIGVTGDHALVDWGLRPPLAVPRNEQQKPLEADRWYVVRVFSDRSGKVLGSTRVEEFLRNTELTVQAGDKVDGLVYRRGPLGLSVIVNDRHQGLVHANEVFKHVSVGDRITAYVKTVRPDGKLDLTLQAMGYRKHIDSTTDLVAKRIRSSGGFLPLSDKSSAEAIHAEFGISKKAFKQALGALYKDRLIRIGEDGVVWVG